MTLKRQAKFTEKRIKSRQRSRLMARAQNIVNDTQVGRHLLTFLNKTDINKKYLDACGNVEILKLHKH